MGLGCEPEMNSVKMSKSRQVQNVRKNQGIDPSLSGSLIENDFLIITILELSGYYQGGRTL